jgi:hypothetical protein
VSSRFFDMPRLCPVRDKPTAQRGFRTNSAPCRRYISVPWPFSWVLREPRPIKYPKRCVRPPNRFARPLSNAPVLNRWFRQSRRLSLLAMRPQHAHAVSGVGPAHELPQQKRAGHLNWIHILVAAAGITFASAVAGVLVYNWYFDSVLVGLSSSLQPLSDAFHQLGAGHLTHASPAPGN